MQLLDSLPYRKRMSHMYQLGKESRTGPETKALLASLEASHGFGGQQLVLQSCTGSRDVSTALKYWAGTSSNLRTLALDILLKIGSNDVVAQVTRPRQ